MATAFSRAAATAATRVIDPGDPISWEFSGFSQHGEDGIIDYLCSRLKERNQYFFEIGSADGLQNCSAWLAFARGYAGVMVEGNPDLSACCRTVLEGRAWNIEAVNLMVDRDNISGLLKMCPHRDPDVFIIDIDGIDYYVAREVLDALRGVGFLDNNGDANEATRPYRDERGALTVPARDWQSQLEKLADVTFVEVWRVPSIGRSDARDRMRPRAGGPPGPITAAGRSRSRRRRGAEG